MDKRSHIHTQFWEEKEQRGHVGLEKSVTSLTGHTRDSATPPPSSTPPPTPPLPAACSAQLLCRQTCARGGTVISIATNCSVTETRF